MGTPVAPNNEPPVQGYTPPAPDYPPPPGSGPPSPVYGAPPAGQTVIMMQPQGYGVKEARLKSEDKRVHLIFHLF